MTAARGKVAATYVFSGGAALDAGGKLVPRQGSMSPVGGLILFVDDPSSSGARQCWRTDEKGLLYPLATSGNPRPTAAHTIGRVAASPAGPLWSTAVARQGKYQLKEQVRFGITNFAGDFELVNCAPISIEESVLQQFPTLFWHRIEMAKKRSDHPEPEMSPDYKDFPKALEQWAERLEWTVAKADMVVGKIAVATVQDTGGADRKQYAVELFQRWKLGHSRQRSDGLLLLFTPASSGKFSGLKVEVGYDLEGVLNDGKVGAMMDRHAGPLLREEKVGPAAAALVEAFARELEQNAPRAAQAAGAREAAHSFGPREIAILIFVLLLLASSIWYPIHVFRSSGDVERVVAYASLVIPLWLAAAALALRKPLVALLCLLPASLLVNAARLLWRVLKSQPDGSLAGSDGWTRPGSNDRSGASSCGESSGSPSGGGLSPASGSRFPGGGGGSSGGGGADREY